MTGESWPRALARLIGRNRRRYGGYLVHAGIAVLFLGVAASSAFVQQRDVRAAPGRHRQGGRLPGHLRASRPRELGGDAAGTGAPISLGAVLRRAQGRQALHDAPGAQLLRDPRTRRTGVISRFFEGEATSEVDVRWGLRRDFWLAVRPDLGSLAEADPRGRPQVRRLARPTCRRSSSPRSPSATARDPPPAAFRAIVSPLVAWIWIGGAIAVLGALVAAWPSPEARLRRVRSLYAARLGRELSRALDARGVRARPARPGALVVALVVLRSAAPTAAARSAARRARIAELEAAKEAKYREIRDAELDHQMGKLSREDWRAVDRDLRGEAIEILRELDRLEGRPPGGLPARSDPAGGSRSPAKSSANKTVQRFRLRSTSEPPPNGPAPVPTPKAPDSPASLPECSRISTMSEPDRRGSTLEAVRGSLPRPRR